MESLVAWLERMKRRTGSALGRAAAILAATIALASLSGPASAGHVNQGEGHGPDATITIVSQPSVVGQLVDGRCGIGYSFQVDFAKGIVIWRTTTEHISGNIGSNTVRSRLVQPVFAHDNDGHEFSLLIELLDESGFPLTSAETDPIISAC